MNEIYIGILFDMGNAIDYFIALIMLRPIAIRNKNLPPFSKAGDELKND
jgi:hypothetical protein